MKNFSLAMLAVFLFLMSSCIKESSHSSTASSNKSSAEKLNGANACNATLADAENIQIFPNNNAWNINISTAPVDSYSDQIIANFSSSALKADFGSGLWQGAPIGIPYVVVCGLQQKYNVDFRADGDDGDYGDESDPGPYAIPLTAPIEGNGVGDAHVISVDKDNGILYELYNANTSGNHWEASSGAIYDLNSNKLRPKGWTSADAAGLPIFPGLVRYEEILKGEIDHAIRFTLQSSNVTPNYYVFNARHGVNSSGGKYSLPFGARMRLKSNYNISSFSPANRIILTAMKNYGIVLADIGSNMYISGAPDARWNNDDLHDLGRVTASDFEVAWFKHKN